MKEIVDLDPASYVRHAVHGDNRCWAETNCYVDVLVELIHSLGFEPSAALSFAVAIDFEVDQWTFFKFAHHDLLEMFGMHIEELNPWVSLVRHIQEQVHAGRPVLVEVDSFYLPDTAGTAYKSKHVKSTIAVNGIDADAEVMTYFHGQGYYRVAGADFRDLFQLGGLVHDRMLPPYIELVKLRKHPRDIQADTLLEQSISSLRLQLSLLPESNPFEKFKTRFARDLVWLRGEPIETFHGYSFATLRQYGACFELVETYLRWLHEMGQAGLTESIDTFKTISGTAKIFQFKLARSLAKNKDLNLDPLDQMAELWQKGTGLLTKKYL